MDVTESFNVRGYLELGSGKCTGDALVLTFFGSLP